MDASTDSPNKRSVQEPQLPKGTESTLEETGKEVVRRFQRGIVTDEAKCRQYAIDPLLEALGWDRSSDEWIREYKLEGSDGPRWVDYALCDGGREYPKVFVEAKGPGDKVTRPESEDQLFKYGAHRGVPLLVLTNGETWRLYYAMGEGVPAEREFDTVCVTEDATGLSRLKKVLARQSVLSGDARRYAEEQQEKRRNAAKARGQIPYVWRDLLSSEHMAKALFERVRKDTGREPLFDDVRAFLNDCRTSAEATIREAEAKSRVDAQPRASQRWRTGDTTQATPRQARIDKELAGRMLDSGRTQAEVARHFGVASSSVAAMVRRTKEAAAQRRDSRASPRTTDRQARIDKDLALQMLESGKTQAEVARHFGVKPSSVSAMVRRNKRV